MFQRSITAGTTSVSIYVTVRSTTTSAPVTSLVYNSAGLSFSYRRPGAAAVSITLAELADSTAAWSSGGFIHIAHGVYRLDLPDAAVAAGAVDVVVSGAATSAFVEPVVIGLSMPVQTAAISSGAVTATAIASDAITAAKIASDAITAAKIAADAVTAAKVAADVTTEISTGLLATTVDGVAISKILQVLLSLASGKVTASTVSGTTTYTFTARDGTTTVLTTAASATDGTRAAVSTIA